MTTTPKVFHRMLYVKEDNVHNLSSSSATFAQQSIQAGRPRQYQLTTLIIADGTIEKGGSFPAMPFDTIRSWWKVGGRCR